jgi:WD40 repeat protein
VQQLQQLTLAITSHCSSLHEVSSMHLCLTCMCCCDCHSVLLSLLLPQHIASTTFAETHCILYLHYHNNHCYCYCCLLILPLPTLLLYTMQNHNTIVKSQQNEWVVSGSADSTVRVWTVPVQQYTSNGSVSPPPGRLNAFLGLPRTEPVVLQGHVGGVLALEVLRKRRGKEGAVLVLSGGEDKQV